jgi:membrane-associated phospholipid phosphatase
LMVFSLVYTGEHYVLDTLVGAAIATYAYLITGRWLQVTAPAFRSRRRAPVGADSHVGA